LDPTAVEESITENTAAIVPVHYAGNPCRVHALRDIADDNDIVLIEDAAEAFGAETEGAKLGSIGDSAILSFCQNKVISTGEGGALLTDDDDVAARARLVRSHGRDSKNYFGDSSGGNYVAIGQNYRMSDITAAVGVAQMEKAEDIVERRRNVAQRYNDRIAELPHVEAPSEPVGGRHVFQLYTVTFGEAVDRDAIIDSLSESGVASKVYFDPVHLSTVYRNEYGYEPGLLPVTEGISSRVLSLPMDPNMAQEVTERVVNALAEAIESTT
jgi:perosamine synthetase